MASLPPAENGTNLGEDQGCIAATFCDDGLRNAYTPKTYDEEDNVDVIAQELTRISIREREAVYEEIHGVAGLSTESPEKLEEITANLEEELQKIKKKSAYDRALFLSPRHVNDPSFRLKFLRSTRFDPKQAAAKIAAFFESKLELFGEDKLVKRITLEDLDETSLAELASGSHHFLPTRDRSNRALCFVMPSHGIFKGWKSKMRAVWYAIMTELENEDSQIHGVVNVYYHLNCPSEKQSEFLAVLPKAHLVAEEVLPYRNVAVHFCYDNPAIRPALQLLAYVASKQTRLRFRSHFGSATECRYALSAFGIPTESLPIDTEGRFASDSIDNLIKKRKQIEEDYMRECEGRIDYPLMRDILLGRGKPYQEYPGNKMLAQVIEARKEEYQNVDRFAKICISIEIGKQMEEAEHRFLTRDKETGGWMEADEGVIREKISGGFRTKKRVPHKASAGLPLVPDQIESNITHDFADTNGTYSKVRGVFEGIFDLGGHDNKRQRQETGKDPEFTI